jgi:large subunit ribosomal protein L6
VGVQSIEEKKALITPSKVGKRPVVIPEQLKFRWEAPMLTIENAKQESLVLCVHKSVKLDSQPGLLQFSGKRDDQESKKHIGTSRALANNMVEGLTKGFQKTLLLKGVGYRANLQGSSLELTLGFSHPVHYMVPKGITLEVPSQTQIIVKGIDKQLVGQVSAKLRAFRSPDAYKGKGVFYADEKILLKEVKK